MLRRTKGGLIGAPGRAHRGRNEVAPVVADLRVAPLLGRFRNRVVAP